MVAHPDRVGIREAQAELTGNFVMLLYDDVPLTANVLAWHANFGENVADKLLFELSIDHNWALYFGLCFSLSRSDSKVLSLAEEAIGTKSLASGNAP